MTNLKKDNLCGGKIGPKKSGAWSIGGNFITRYQVYYI